MGLSTLVGIVREPVLAETRQNLARSRARVAADFQVPQQMLGRQANSCGATIGAMPRCDFACRGCYLGDEANRIPAASLDEIKRQMRELRPLLGNPGNVQLTDGEITLRPDHEVIELLQYAIGLGLIPMVMTHGDTFRRRPGLLERYMVEGGLLDVSIHVDTTQRGRLGDRWRAARTEADLNPLRDEFAALVRAARAATGLPLRCATTVTVTRDNLHGIPDVMRWLTGNADVFRMISFQPIAQVGRTEDGLGGGVDGESLWQAVARGLPPGRDDGELRRAHQWLGHPDCNRFVHGVLVRRGGEPVDYMPIRVDGDPVGPPEVDGFLQRFGGISFRRDTTTEGVVRALALTLRAPWFMTSGAVRLARTWLARIAPGAPLRAVRELLRGDVRLDPLVIVSHHFMSREELETPVGKERLAHCVLHVNIDGETLSMCEANALGRRAELYSRLAQGTAAATPVSVPVPVPEVLAPVAPPAPVPQQVPQGVS